MNEPEWIGLARTAIDLLTKGRQDRKASLEIERLEKEKRIVATENLIIRPTFEQVMEFDPKVKAIRKALIIGSGCTVSRIDVHDHYRNKPLGTFFDRKAITALRSLSSGLGCYYFRYSVRDVAAMEFWKNDEDPLIAFWSRTKQHRPRSRMNYQGTRSKDHSLVLRQMKKRRPPVCPRIGRRDTHERNV